MNRREPSWIEFLYLSFNQRVNIPFVAFRILFIIVGLFFRIHGLIPQFSPGLGDFFPPISLIYLRGCPLIFAELLYVKELYEKLLPIIL